MHTLSKGITMVIATMSVARLAVYTSYVDVIQSYFNDI